MSKRNTAIKILIEERILTAEMNTDLVKKDYSALAARLHSTALHRLLADMIWEG